jgi:hypothetical protein
LAAWRTVEEVAEVIEVEVIPWGEQIRFGLLLPPSLEMPSAQWEQEVAKTEQRTGKSIWKRFVP